MSALKIVKPQPWRLQRFQQPAIDVKGNVDAKTLLKNQWRVLSSATLVDGAHGWHHLSREEYENMPFAEAFGIVAEIYAKFGCAVARQILEKQAKAYEQQVRARFLSNSCIPRLQKIVTALEEQRKQPEQENQSDEFSLDELSKVAKEKDRSAFRAAIQKFSADLDRLGAKLKALANPSRLDILKKALLDAKVEEAMLSTPHLDCGDFDIEKLNKPLLSLSLSPQDLGSLLEKLKVGFTTWFEMFTAMLVRVRRDSSPPPKLPLIQIPSVQPNSPNFAA
jgi:hypothetical protein